MALDRDAGKHRVDAHREPAGEGRNTDRSDAVDRERRRYARFQVPVKVVVKGGGLNETCLTDQVGMGGCEITLSRRLPEGTLLQVELSSTRLQDSLSGTAQVAWTSADAPWHTGLSFSQSLVEAMGPFLRALVGSARLTTDGR
jgi:hypothetical protein